MQVYDWEKLEREIIDWHAKTFPDATMEGQLIKLEEEMNELANSANSEEGLKEAADVYIVLCGLKRWNCQIEKFVTRFWFVPVSTLYKAVVEKMNKNKARVWAKTAEGTYHHTNDESNK